MKCKAIQVVDLGFGDSGKGTMVDYLVRLHAADVVVRFNGGPQAGHNVVLPDGTHHTFSQFGSGSFVPGVRTLLSRFMLIEPYAMLNEAAHLESVGAGDVMSRTMIDERCLVIMPPQQIANRIRERARGSKAHGTCGMGVGECVGDSIEQQELSLFAGDLHDPAKSRQKLERMLEFKRHEIRPLRAFITIEEARVLDDPTWIDTAMNVYGEMSRRAEILHAEQSTKTFGESSCIVFEGAQGVLLDEVFGAAPHTTWSKTTFVNSDELLSECRQDFARHRIGVMRTYMTRHGAGPFQSFDEQLQNQLPEPHNTDGGWQGRFRRGPLDMALLEYSLKSCGGVDALAVTHLDRLPQLPGAKNAASFVTELEHLLNVPIEYLSRGPTYLEKECAVDQTW